ncbi:MAG TPA: PEP-CTERM sorting domain-containing protein [Chthoniobacterales bacterium]|nr:PEP-CTERM sorting domain-containing protein [Chthoniobacterales bacterium]
MHISFRNRTLAASALIAVALLLGNSTVNAQSYILDDGTAENSVGLNGGGGADIIVLNSFAVTGGFNVINSISIAFGSPGGTGANMNGVAFTAILWNDPNGDGSPTDATVLTTAPGVVSGFSTNAFVTVSLTPTAVLTPNFFVGFLITQPDPAFPAAFDQTAPTFANRSFVTGGTTGDINDLNNNDLPVAAIESFGLVGNWLIRANAIPEPSTYMLAGLGLLGLLGLRRFTRGQKVS